MIRKLFNNRVFILSLAICSGLLMLRSIAAPFFDMPDYSGVEDPEFYLEEDVPTELEVVATDRFGTGTDVTSLDDDTIWRAEQSVLSGQLTWNSAPARDPFSGIGSVSVAVDSAPASGMPVVVGIPRLDALVAGPKSLLAVLNDQIVREGDLIGGYEVTRISPSGVRLASRHASHWLAVSDMETESESEPVRADQEVLAEPADELAGLMDGGEPGG